MPRENRKRGKKNKRHIEQTQEYDSRDRSDHSHGEDELQNFPGLDHEGGLAENPPFGVLDPDVKAYFRRVGDQLRDWQEERPHVDIEADVDLNEERRMFFAAALSEMNGKELQLATDPDCSPVLERMLYSMDDFTRRVFADSLAGSWLQLITDRFASHVCQTLFTVVADTIARETRGILPSPPASDDSRGELLTMTKLVLNTCEDIIAELPRLIQSPFASHVLRALLLLLAPLQLALPQAGSHRHAPSARSKKSASWNARCGPMKAMITADTHPSGSGEAENAALRTPNSFARMARRFVEQIRNDLDGNEVRALAVDKVSSPSLQMLLQLEASVGIADASESMMDHVLTGLITDTLSAVTPATSSYVHALFLDATSSHLLETIFSCCSSNVFHRLWDCYVRCDLQRLSTHPVANFVVARGVERLDERELGDAVTQLLSTWSKFLKSSRMGVLTAMIDRATKISAHEAELVEAICSMVEVHTDEERKYLVSCLLRLKTRTEYQDTLVKNEGVEVKDPDASAGPQLSKKIGIGPQSPVLPEPKVQGSILLQSLLRLHEPYNHIVLESLNSLLPTDLLALAHNATSSRILDAALESPTVPLRSRKRLVTAFIGHFHLLADDRIGSRVADRCWKAADPYLKEKIARSLIPHEQFLAGSHFGRFFARNINLPLLQRKPDQWKALQSKPQNFLTDANTISATRTRPSHSSVGETEAVSVPSPSDPKHGSKRKRMGAVGGDEIDALFNGIGAKKRAKGIADIPMESNVTIEKGDATLDAVFGAIKAAPSDARRRKNK